MKLLAPKIPLFAPPPKLASPLGKTAPKAGTSFGRLVQGKEGEHLAGKPGTGLGGLRSSHAEPEPEDLTGHPKRKLPEEPALDPTSRNAAQMAPPFLTAPMVETVVGSHAVEAHVRTSLEDLLPQMVRKVAWSGDGKRGTVRLELGHGELAGATLLIHADQGRIAVHLSAPGGADLSGWRDRIAARLASRGLTVDNIEVE